jgi:hypothetical protein
MHTRFLDPVNKKLSIKSLEHHSPNLELPFFYTYKVLSESSRTVIVVIASVKEDERGGQGHTSASLLHQSAT